MHAAASKIFKFIIFNTFKCSSLSRSFARSLVAYDNSVSFSCHIKFTLTYAHLAKEISHRSRQILVVSCGKKAKFEIFLRIDAKKKTFRRFLMRLIIQFSTFNYERECYKRSFLFLDGIKLELCGRKIKFRGFLVWIQKKISEIDFSKRFPSQKTLLEHHLVFYFAVFSNITR